MEPKGEEEEGEEDSQALAAVADFAFSVASLNRFKKQYPQFELKGALDKLAAEWASKRSLTNHFFQKKLLCEHNITPFSSPGALLHFFVGVPMTVFNFFFL